MSILVIGLALLATLASIARTILVLGANMMSDAPTEGFQGGWTLLIPWGITAFLWVAWWHG